MLWVINNPIIYKFLKDFTMHRNKTGRVVVFNCRPFPSFLNTENTNETFQQSGEQDSFRHLLKVQTPTSLEPPLEYNQDQTHLTNQGSLWAF